MTDLANAGHVKIAILAKGLNIEERAKQGLGTEAQEKIYSYSITDWVDKKVVFPSEIKLEDRVYAGFHYRPSSNFRLGCREEGGLAIFSGDVPLISASLIKRPRYYAHTTREGVPLQAIGVSCANHGISFFINDYCQYFRESEDCRFCTLVPTQKRFNDTLKYKNPHHVDEAMAKVLELGDRIDFVQLSGGSLYDHNREVRNYIQYIELIRKHLESKGLYGKVPLHLTCMPPRNLGILHELRQAGLNTISFDLECPTQAYFEKYCPGKTRSYGYPNMRKALETARDVFGKGNAFTIIIAGIEPLESFLRGTTTLIEAGIVPTINIYHHDPLTTKMDVGEPQVADLVGLTYEIAKQFRKHNVKPGLLGCAHYDIGHEIRKGYFDGTR